MLGPDTLFSGEKSFLSSLAGPAWNGALSPSELTRPGHIPFPGCDEVVWEAFWLGEITLLNPTKEECGFRKVPASTWEWHSEGPGWRRFPCEKHFQSPTEPGLTAGLPLSSQRGSNHSRARCCNLGVYVPRPRCNPEATRFKTEPPGREGASVKAARRFLPSLSEGEE